MQQEPRRFSKLIYTSVTSASRSRLFQELTLSLWYSEPTCCVEALLPSVMKTKRIYLTSECAEIMSVLYYEICLNVPLIFFHVNRLPAHWSKIRVSHGDLWAWIVKNRDFNTTQQHSFFVCVFYYYWNISQSIAESQITMWINNICYLNTK